MGIGRKNLVSVRVFSVMLVAATASVVTQAASASEVQDIYGASLTIHHVSRILYGGYNNVSAFGDGRRVVLTGQTALGKLQNTELKYKESPTYEASDIFPTNRDNLKITAARKVGQGPLTYAVISNSDTVYIAVYGSKDDNWLYNFAATPLPGAAFDNVETHPGWSALTVQNWGLFQEALNRHGAANKRVILTGHSQGGAVAGHLAFIMAKHKLLNRQKQHRLITFGAPRYALPAFRQKFEAYRQANAPGLRAYALELEEDVVPGTWATVTSGQAMPLGVIIRRAFRECGRYADDTFHHSSANYAWLAKHLGGGSDHADRADITADNILRGGQFAESVDTITTSVANDRPEGVIGLKLQTTNNITWWKAIRVYADGTLIGELSTQDNKHVASGTLAVNPNAVYEIEFCKAKEFGAHRAVAKHTIDLHGMSGTTLTFTWSKDW